MSDRRIVEALERSLDLGEVGVQVAAYLGEELIIDEHIGLADEATKSPVDSDTLFPVFSVTKALVVTAIHLQVARGRVDLDRPIAAYWPEYGVNGKHDITIRDVLVHRAGVPQMPPDLTVERLGDWEWVTDRLAEVVPWCPPRDRSMYHPRSFGFILGEVIRRTDPLHRMFGAFLREELCEPLGINDVWVGLPAELEHRVATLTYGMHPPDGPQIAPNPIRDASLPASLPANPTNWNLPIVHQACVPSSTGIMNARDGARFFALLANRGELGGVRLLSEDYLYALTAPRPNPLQVDEALGMVTWIGIGGYWLGGPHPPADPVVGSKTHTLAFGGAGGSIAWADLDGRVSSMITHNRMFGSVSDEAHPFIAVGDAIREIAGERS